MQMNIHTGVLLGVLALGFAACGTVEVSRDINDYARQIAELEQTLTINDQNAEALRDLGVIYFQAQRYDRADSLLIKSVKIEPNDSKSQFYLGMTHEQRGDTTAALAVYINYTDFSLFADYRRLMEGRYRALSANVIQSQFQQALRNESALTNNDVQEGTVAVFPLKYQGPDPKYAPLGLGLAELMIIDLGQVESLRLVERIRIESLLDELNFGSSQYVDPSTAPRMGRLLRAADLVTGTYAVSGEESMRMDVQPMFMLESGKEEPLNEAGALEELFRLEKDIVFSLIDRFGITLTPLEKERIERIPTENIQAFLLYCIGLQHQDERDFRTALVYYDQAFELDPQFTLAKEKAVAMESVVLAGGTRSGALLEAYKVDPPIATDGGTSASLVQRRIENMGNNSATTFIPSTESRAPMGDAVRSGASILALPDPPPPPAK